MKSARLALVLAAALGFSATLAAAPEPAAWLYYSMYPGDHSHAVHLSALRQRPDGLLESASRYPRFDDEPWSEAESARGRYNYVPRLIDCETGFSIETGQQLLDADGRIVASRDNAAAALAEWKRNLDNELGKHQWPVKDEHFLACAGARDDNLQAARRKLAGTPPPRLTYKPIFSGLSEDSEALFARISWREPEVPAKGRIGPATKPVAVFEAAVRRHDQWLAGFMPAKPPVRRADRPALSEDRLNWLKEHGADVEAVHSRGDGTLEYVNRNPSRFELPYSVLVQRPAASENASRAGLLQRIDCRSGLLAGVQLDWLDAEGRLLARQVLPGHEVKQDLDQQMAGLTEDSLSLFANPPPERDTGALVCLAAAAQCSGSKPRFPEAFALKAADYKSIEQAATAADALLAVRAAHRAYRQRLVPDCRIGKPD